MRILTPRENGKMKRRKLRSELKKRGWFLVRSGNHEVWRHSLTRRTMSVSVSPRDRSRAAKNTLKLADRLSRMKLNDNRGV